MFRLKIFFLSSTSGVVETDSFGYFHYPNWRIVGAVRFNNFGRIVERKSFFELDEIRDWRYKNGKQKWHLVDEDHGTQRIWMEDHSVAISAKEN